jgi:hypothetical protein
VEKIVALLFVKKYILLQGVYAHQHLAGAHGAPCDF